MPSKSNYRSTWRFIGIALSCALFCLTQASGADASNTSAQNLPTAKSSAAQQKRLSKIAQSLFQFFDQRYLKDQASAAQAPQDGATKEYVDNAIATALADAKSQTSGPGFWSLAGNIVDSTSFLGTLNNVSLKLFVFGQLALRFETSGVLDTTPNMIGGDPNNSIDKDASGSVIVGGGLDGNPNVIHGSFSFMGTGTNNTIAQSGSVLVGGALNTVKGLSGTIVGGNAHAADGEFTFIGAGFDNHAADDFTAIAGGSGNSAAGQYSFIGGGSTNTTSDAYATIGGGLQNRIVGSYGTVAGGFANLADGNGFVGGGFSNEAAVGNSTVAGGWSNLAGGQYSFVGGGYINQATGLRASVVGGQENTSTAENSFVGGGVHNNAVCCNTVVAGGDSNSASGHCATVPGGESNCAEGDASLAAGTAARAHNDGEFVWADHSATATFPGPNETLFTPTPNDFLARATGGVVFVSGADNCGNALSGVRLAPGSGSWTSLSDRNSKANFERVDVQEVLKQLVSVPIQRWNYKAQATGIRHIGPMSQDFSATFAVGEDDRGISVVDAEGVSMAAIQGLYEIVNRISSEKQQEIDALKAQNARLEAKLVRIEKMLDEKSR